MDTNEEIVKENETITDSKVENIEDKQDLTSQENNNENDKANESKDIKLDDFVEKKQIKISLTQFIFILMFVIVMILAAIQNLLYFRITGI